VITRYVQRLNRVLPLHILRDRVEKDVDKELGDRTTPQTGDAQVDFCVSGWKQKGGSGTSKFGGT